MVNILEFPDELLLQITNHTVPFGIDNFNECCKRIYGLSRDTRQTHLEHCVKYRNVCFCEQPAEFSHPLELLRDILLNHRVSLYVGNLAFGYIEPHQSLDLAQYGAHFIDGLEDRIVKALIECPYIQNEEIKIWTAQIMKGEMDAVVALLLPLLPSLWIIELNPILFPFGDRCRLMIDKIAEVSGEENPAKPALTHLSNCLVISDDYQDTDDLMSILTHFGALPSIRRLCCARDANSYSPPLFDVTEGLREEGTMDLKLIQCEIDRNHSVSLLKSFKALRSFTLRQHGHFNMPQWSPADLCSDLQTYAKDSLEELDLSWWADSQNAEIPPAVGNLSNFPVLKRLRVSLRAVLKRAEDGIRTQQPLISADFLPASIEKLVLVGHLYPNHAAWMLDHLLDMQHERLPKLRKIVLEGSDGDPDSEPRIHSQTVAACERAGVTLEMAPGWKS
jgi:hypothetical protein